MSRSARSLRETIRDELFTTYEFDPAKRYDIQTYLHRFLNEVCFYGDIVHIFTTNYDYVIEEGLRDSEKYAVVDGFRLQHGVNEWDPSTFDEPPVRPKEAVKYRAKVYCQTCC